MSQLKIILYSILQNIFGQEVIQNLYLKRCISIYKKKKIIFVHVPRSAGTSICCALYGKRVGHFSIEQIMKNMDGNDFNNFFKFSVVRNPHDRLFSAYRYARYGGASKGAIRKLPDYSSDDFSTYEKFINNWLVYQDLSNLDYIFRPQHTYLFVNNELFVEYIGKIEYMNEVEEVLKNKVSMNISIGMQNKGYKHQTNKKMTDKTKSIVYELYRKDFELFGYPF